jgi:hypothetical protein
MTLIHYTATVKGKRILELPPEADALHLEPGQSVDIQLEPMEAGQVDETLALFERWEKQDAARTPEQIAADADIWEEFEKGINTSRQAQGMRLL